MRYRPSQAIVKKLSLSAASPHGEGYADLARRWEQFAETRERATNQRAASPRTRTGGKLLRATRPTVGFEHEHHPSRQKPNCCQNSSKSFDMMNSTACIISLWCEVSVDHSSLRCREFFSRNQGRVRRPIRMKVRSSALKEQELGRLFGFWELLAEQVYERRRTDSSMASTNLPAPCV
jgi:hypothetical protein